MPSIDLNFVVDHNPIAYIFNKIFKHFPILSIVPEYLSNLLIHKPAQNTKKFLFALGVFAITVNVVHKLYKEINRWKWMPKHLQNRKELTAENLKKRYGNCYVVITGCTDGIGLAYAIEFARFGFGLVMVARNKQKLQARIMQIKNICPEVDCRRVIGDLSKIQDIKRVSQQLKELSQKIDIGIVVNNAGYAGQVFDSFIKKDVKQLNNIMNINFTSSYHFNAALLPILRQRKQRSAILNITSCVGVYLSQGNGTYTTSKVLLDIYSRTMAMENKDKVDVLSVRPFGVRTSMMAMNKGKFMITPKDCVLSSLADLGKTDTTYTGLMHKIQASYFDDYSEWQRFGIYSKLFDHAKK